MSALKHLIDPETYVLCEKAANASGKKTVEEWLSFLISEKVGHTHYFSPVRVGFTHGAMGETNAEARRGGGKEAAR